jgi:hypothetical protein
MIRASALRAPADDQEALDSPPVLHLSPAPGRHPPRRLLDGEGAADALARFLDDARAILDRLEEAWTHREAGRPGIRVRREILRFLAGAGVWVDFNDLPSTGLPDVAGERSMVRRLAEEGVVKLREDPAHPGTLLLRITPEGQEELRRRGVEEAMGYLRGVDDEALGVVRDASRALRRLSEVV